MTSLTRALGTPLEETVTYTRNAANLLTEETDALGRVTHYQYDAKGNPTQVTQVSSRRTAMDRFGRAI